MKKLLVVSLIVFLILFTAVIKNSTKKIDDKIFIVNENLRILVQEFEDVKLEFEYLSSSEKLVSFHDLYFGNELKQKNIQEINIIKKKNNKLNFEQLKLIDD
tara:strand:+ start:261 stop:566 length:306 start_codon:yes stop_codon:yes gene_type:complete